MARIVDAQFRYARSMLVLLLSWFLVQAGCVVAMGNRGTVSTGSRRQAVAYKDGLYIIDVRTGEVSRIDDAKIEDAPSFSPGESDPTEETTVIEK
jgi:hypothetical protein